MVYIEVKAKRKEIRAEELIKNPPRVNIDLTEKALSRFHIKEHYGRSPKYHARKIIKVMRMNLVDRYEVHAYGKEDVKECEQVIRLLSRWINVKHLETGYIDQKTN